ncbi:hypothetical protein NJB18001_27660 [Mycobacterium marinum]|nr:hypothetical protein NJB18001_27660 [Mycobacterium marinum]
MPTSFLALAYVECKDAPTRRRYGARRGGRALGPNNGLSREALGHTGVMSLVMPAYPPYPPARYTGDKGEVSARLKRRDEPPNLELGGTKYHFLATQKTTDGDFGLYRVDIAPAGGGPGPHFHKTMSESFFVLSGSMRMHDGRDWVDASAGDYLYVPPGGVHGFRNESDQPASILILFAPGAPREDYFEGFPGLADMTDDQRREFFVAHDNFWVQ